MTVKSPARILKDILLEAVAILDDDPTADWSAHISQMPALPIRAFSITDTGGSNPNPAIQLDYTTVQVRGRGNVNDFETLYDKLSSVKDRLLGIPSRTMGTDRVISVTCIGDILNIGRDENDCPTLALNFRVILERTPTSESHRIAV